MEAWKEKTFNALRIEPMEGFAPLISALVLIASFLLAFLVWLFWQNNLIVPGLISLFLFFLLLTSFHLARQWEKVVILRWGRLHRLIGPGLFLVLPLVEKIVDRIDQRIMTTTFNAEQTLTRDTVPVNVDAVMFWMVWDPVRAVLEVSNYQQAVTWAAQTALRETIGRHLLSEILAGREELDEELQQIIDKRTEPWGVAVQAVEIRDVIIPSALQESMSREAQAERERQARMILAGVETELAQKMVEAAHFYLNNPIAAELRSLNLLYEGLKEGNGVFIIPSAVVQSLSNLSKLSMSKEMTEKNPC